MPPLSIAHRGGAALVPENTLAAFKAAIELGADGAELDVQLTREGHLVVVHDFRLNPDLSRDETGRWIDAPPRSIRDITLAEMLHIDVGRARPGSAYAHEHPLMSPRDGEHIPLLTDVIDLVRQAPRTFLLFVELKTSFADPCLTASPESLAEAAVEALQRTEYVENCRLVGFDWRALRRAKEIEPSLRCWFSTRAQSWFGDTDPPPTDDPPPKPVLTLLRSWARSGTSPWAAGYDAVHYDGSIVAAVKAAGGDGWFSYAADATPGAIAEAHALGLQVGAWTVNDQAGMQTLARSGIDAICTDRPDLMTQLTG